MLNMSDKFWSDIDLVWWQGSTLPSPGSWCYHYIQFQLMTSGESRDETRDNDMKQLTFWCLKWCGSLVISLFTVGTECSQLTASVLYHYDRW